MATFNVNTDLVKGNDMYLFITLPDSGGNISTAITDAQVVAYATSCSLEINADTIDTTSKFSCRWNSVMQGNASYTVNADALYALQSKMAAQSAYTIDDLFEAMVDGKNVGWFMAPRPESEDCSDLPTIDSSAVYYYGTAAITSLSITAGNNEVCSSSITLTGDGIINKAN
jgi:predicted secreted protein